MILSPNKKQRLNDIKIGYLGSNCSFTCRAATRFFSQNEFLNISNIEYDSVHSCQAVFQKVASGNLVYGVVPIESSSHGTISGPYDQLLKFSGHVKIIAETVEMETYCLSTNPASSSITTEENLSRVISHSTILEDSSDYFDSLDAKRISQGLPIIERIPAVDSAAACKTLLSMTDSSGTAVICCREAAEVYNLSIIAPSIGNDRNSETRYLIIARYVDEQFIDPLHLAVDSQLLATQRENIKSTLTLSLKNVSGAMFRMISCFALRDLNVYKVETRPSNTAIGLQDLPSISPGTRFKHWDLIFFIDYQPSDQNNVNEALLNNLSEYSVWIRSLGTYRQFGQRQTVTEPSNWSNMVDILATA